MTTALVVGGTGPTGVPLVEMLLREGHEVTIFHSGAHETPFPAPVEHLHGDPRESEQIHALFAGRTWDIAVCTTGRLRLLADALRGKVRRLVGVTGSPVYAGTMRPIPTGRLPLPIREDATRQADSPGYAGRIAAGEDFILQCSEGGAYEGVVIRYPGIYGPRAPLNNEWVVVRHCLDERSFIVVPDGGTSYFHRAYASNAARLLFLAATHPSAVGQAFNAGDDAVMSAARLVEVVADELDSPLRIEPVPAALCQGVFPMADKSSQILDTSKARALLGYRDLLDVEAATRLTARWLAEHAADGEDARAGGPPPIDYAREDRIAQWWRDATRSFAAEFPVPASAGTAPITVRHG